MTRNQGYHTIEVTESFYILQSLINAQIFQAQYQNHAQIDARGLGIAEMGPLEATEPNKKHYWAFEETSAIHVTRTPRMAQYPWWRLGDLVENDYDVITMNANLTEFSKAALFHYVEVVKRALKQDGFLFATAKVVVRLICQQFSVLFRRLACGLSPFCRGRCRKQSAPANLSSQISCLCVMTIQLYVPKPPTRSRFRS